jgi:signal transduction histidine kinase
MHFWGIWRTKDSQIFLIHAMIDSMSAVRDRILIVENDPVVADLIGRQALQSVGFQVFIVGDASTAISKALQWAPDLIISDTNLPGLSGKDLMVALTSQGISTPLILLAPKGQEQELIQTFRLGAADFLLMPVREAEVLSAVERVLKQVHEHRERDRLAQKLQQTNQELQMRVRELTTIFSVGKAVTSITDMNLLMEKALEGAAKVTQADLGWFLLREDLNKPFVLVSSRNLPPSLNVHPGQVWDDGISSLVAMSGEALTIHGEPLKRFKIYMLGQSALIAPIKVQKNVIGLLVVMRKQATPFASSEQHLLDALADYASISLVNAHLFRSSDERARTLQALAENAQMSEKVTNEVIRLVKKEVGGTVDTALNTLLRLGKDPTARWRPEQRQMISAIQDYLEKLRQLSEAMAPLPLPQITREGPRANLNEIVAQAIRRGTPFAQQGGLALVPDLPGETVFAQTEPALAGQILDGLVSNAIKFCGSGGQIVVRLERTADRQAQITVRTPGALVDAKDTARIFEDGYKPDANRVQRFGGLGVRLSLVKDMLTRQGGKIWLENQPNKGVSFFVTLPLVRT